MVWKVQSPPSRHQSKKNINQYDILKNGLPTSDFIVTYTPIPQKIES